MQVEPLRSEYRDRDAAHPNDGRAGPRRRVALPDARLRCRAGLRHDPGDDGERVAPSIAGSRRTGASTTRAGSSRRRCSRSPIPTRRTAELESLLERGREDRARASGARAVGRTGPRSLGDPCTIRVWARLAEAGSRSRSISATAATGRTGGGVGREVGVRGLRQARTCSSRHPRRRSGDLRQVASLIVHGVFHRHPRLRVASIENGSDWVAPAREAPAQEGEPDALGLPRGSARHDASHTSGSRPTTKRTSARSRS